MQISVDLSLYPLRDDYIPVIIDFIHRVQAHEGDIAADGLDVARHLDLALVELCLLYTSPSPRDGLLSRMPSSA